MHDSLEQKREIDSRRSPHPALFFLGCERSGTTFVQETLNEHYSIAEGNESKWVLSGYRKSRDAATWSRREQERFIQSMLSDWYFANMANYHAVFFDYRDFVQDGGFDFAQFVRGIFQHIADTKGKDRVLNKTCLYCCHMDIVDAVYGNPPVVHIIRDGRDVALSLLEVKNWGPVSIYGAAKWWAGRVDEMQRHAREHMNGRYYEFRYEDLVVRPAEIFEQIAKCFGVYDESRHTELAAAIKIIPGNSEKWRKQMSPAQIRLFERVAKQTLEHNGYAFFTPADRLQPLPAWLDSLYSAREAVLSRIGLYPLWFRMLKFANRVIGFFPALQRKFFRTNLFAEHFSWNKIRSRFKNPGR